MAHEIMNEPGEANSPLFVQEKQTYAQRRERIATAALRGCFRIVKATTQMPGWRWHQSCLPMP